MLQNIAQKALLPTDSPDWVVATDLVVAWSPWQLKLRVRDADTALKAQPATTPPSDIKAQLQNGGQAFKSLSTENVQLTIEGTIETYNVGVQFIGHNVFLMAVPAIQVPNFQLPEFLAADTSIAQVSPPAETGLIAKLPHAFTVHLLNTDLRDKVFVIQRSASGSPTVTVRHLGVTGGADSFRISGRVLDIANDNEADAQIDWQGPDLKLSAIKLNAVLNACNGLGTIPKAKCIAKRKALAALLSNVLTSRYKDTPLRPFGPRTAFPVQLNGTQYNLRSAVIRSESTNHALLSYLDFVLEGL